MRRSTRQSVLNLLYAISYARGVAQTDRRRRVPLVQCVGRARGALPGERRVLDARPSEHSEERQAATLNAVANWLAAEPGSGPGFGAVGSSHPCPRASVAPCARAADAYHSVRWLTRDAIWTGWAAAVLQ